MKCAKFGTKSAASAIVLLLILASTSAAIERRGNRHYGRSSQSNFIGAWSINISADEIVNDDDNQYRGVRFTLARQYARNQGFRFNLDLAEKGPDFYDTRVFTTEDYSFTMRSLHNVDLGNVGVSAEYMVYSAPPGKPRLYFGFGPAFNVEEIGKDIYVNYDYNYDWVQSIDFNDSFMFGAGVSGAVGFEMFLGRNLSMNVEYGLAIQHQWYFFDVDYYDQFGYHHTEVDSYSDGLDFGDSHIRLGISAYF